MSRILVIDDDEQIRWMLRQMLEHEGYEVVDAPDGKVAMILQQEEPADLIITDLLMPEKDGIETIREMRKGFPHVKIIAISGGGAIGPEEYLDLAEKLGSNHTFVKPVRRKEMLEVVRDLIGA